MVVKQFISGILLKILKTFFIIIILINPFLSIGQTCLPGGITFSTQQQIDDFASDYPGCTDILGDVTIQGSSIVNLDGLSPIENIDGTLRINSNTNLVSLTGLSNLQAINGQLWISFCSLITNLQGLENIDPLTINASSSTNSDIVITGNFMLSDCAVTSICEALVLPTTIAAFSINLSGCNSLDEVETACAALPLMWVRQPTVIETNNHNQISWTVSQQINNDKFEIEYGYENEFFQKIGEIVGGGTHNEEVIYSFEHLNPLSGDNYYRVKQIDFDGNFSYSDIASIYNLSDNAISIYPNPTSLDAISISVKDELNYTIHYSDGRIKEQGTLNNGENHIDLSSFESGFYFFKSQFGTQMIVKM